MQSVSGLAKVKYTTAERRCCGIGLGQLLTDRCGGSIQYSIRKVQS